MAGLFRRKGAADAVTSAAPGSVPPGSVPPGSPAPGAAQDGAAQDGAAQDGAAQPGPARRAPGPPPPAEGLSEVIRPAAIVPEHAARQVLVELARRDLSNGGEWQSEPQLWSRFDRPSGDGERPPELMGTIHVSYGTPTKYEITLYRVTVTAAGLRRRLDRRLAHRRGAALRGPDPPGVPTGDGEPAAAAVHVLTPVRRNASTRTAERAPGVTGIPHLAYGECLRVPRALPITAADVNLMTLSSSSNRRQRDGPSALPTRAGRGVGR